MKFRSLEDKLFWAYFGAGLEYGCSVAFMLDGAWNIAHGDYVVGGLDIVILVLALYYAFYFRAEIKAVKQAIEADENGE